MHGAIFSAFSIPFDAYAQFTVSGCVRCRRNHNGKGSCWLFAAMALCARLYERHGCVVFGLSCMFPAVRWGISYLLR